MEPHSRYYKVMCWGWAQPPAAHAGQCCSLGLSDVKGVETVSADVALAEGLEAWTFLPSSLHPAICSVLSFQNILPLHQEAG